MDSYSDFVQNLRTKAWRTSGARFEAARRLRRRDKWSSYSIAALSIIALVLGIAGLAPDLPPVASIRGMGAFTGIAISVFVLVISLLEGAGSHSVNAERFHRCGVELGEVQAKVQVLQMQHPLESPEAWESAKRLMEMYQQRVRECPINHEPIDDHRFIVRHRNSPEFHNHGFSGWAGAVPSLWAMTQYWLSAVWLPLFSGIVVFVLLLSGA